MDYKSTIFLPHTDFPMRANLAQLELRLLARWQKLNLYQRLRKHAENRKKFVLHDGPPYANGHLHIGHALNKILKDVIVKSRQMASFDANYVPGWDCHGLPIEWKVEEKYLALGVHKDTIDPLTFRHECRAFAQYWITIQSQEFQRLGVIADWGHPYTTMDYAAEASIISELSQFLAQGNLYRGTKPILWSVVEQTALSDAEVEYYDRISTNIFVCFPIVWTTLPVLQNTSVVIWTTTPWTLPGNRAIAFDSSCDYSIIEVLEVSPISLAGPGEKLVLSKNLVSSVSEISGIVNYRLVDNLKGSILSDTVCAHPWRGKGYDFDVPLLEADFVTQDYGTGFVHIAPGHGENDWRLGKMSGLPIPEIVSDNGTFYSHIPLLAGKHVFHVDKLIIELLKEVNALLAHRRLVHSYPHSWRSKSPLIFRVTPQWFIAMDVNNLRFKALAAIDATRWIPEQSRNRIRSMLESRPDWCISRQRIWGVPIAVFVNRITGIPLYDQKVFNRIISAVYEEGCDVWFTADSARFLSPEYDPNMFEKVTDILDVWFDSGTTHAFVLERRTDLQWPASLYLEGSDQHRGWFNSSLLESCATRGRAPYETVLTHGFVLSEDGQKMSKSLGNIITPQKIVEQFGADILRLWVVGSDYTEDLHISTEILKQTSDVYRRLRNTLRYLLGSLFGFQEEEYVSDYTVMPELERWVLHRLWQLNNLVCQHIHDYDFHCLLTELSNFCTIDLSAFYFDIRKDTLYCDRFDSLRRRSTRTVFDILFQVLVRWLAPFISFTAEEAWIARYPKADESVHEQTFRDIPTIWQDNMLFERWKRIRQIRKVVTSSLEKERMKRRVGSNLQVSPIIYVSSNDQKILKGIDLSELIIVSSCTIIEGEPPDEAYTLPDIPLVGVLQQLAVGKKCQRCWKILPDVGTYGYGDVCSRCADTLDYLKVQ